MPVGALAMTVLPLMILRASPAAAAAHGFGIVPHLAMLSYCPRCTNRLSR
jgi:hypothetical protein